MSKARLYKENGEPKFIRCFEQKRNPAIDRFCVVYTRANVWGGKEMHGRVFYVAMSDKPFHPLGFGQHGEAEQGSFRAIGSRVEFSSLPADCQKLVKQDYAELWRAE
jgi:hypothetical protein